MTEQLKIPFDTDIRNFPNYDRAVPWPAVIPAEQLTPARFRSYVRDQCPLLIKGAVRHWPAFVRWTTSDLRDRIGHCDVVVRTAPLMEFPSDGHAYNRATRRRMTFAEFLDLAQTDTSHLAVHALRLEPPEHDATKLLAADIAGFPWLPRAGAARAYPAARVFFYQNSYTDWHHHAADETIMTQVIGAKEVLLLPPNAQTARALRPLHDRQGHCTNVAPEIRAAFSNLIPYRALVEPGDGLYIPIYWWHAVADAHRQFGATVAVCWAGALSAIGDLRMEPARRMMRASLRTRYAPIFAIAMAWSVLSRILWRPPFWVPARTPSSLNRA